MLLLGHAIWGLNNKMKNCNRCKISQEDTNFYKDKTRLDGLEYICKSCAQKKQQKYKSNNYEILQKKALNYSRRPDIKIKSRLRKKERLKTDISYRMSENIRRRINLALHGKNKSKSTLDMLGCSIDFLKQYMSNKFDKNMSWDNYGLYGWHIDHIIPLSSAKNKEELEKLCHYSNLQPLWAKDNLQKSNKIKA